MVSWNTQRCKWDIMTHKGPRCFFVKLRTKVGGHFDPPPLTSETKEARTVKLCTAITYYITSITKQLKFLNSHCSIVCIYCSVVCLIAKNGQKMIEFSSSFKLTEVHMADSPFNEDPKNMIFSREAQILGRDGRKI